MKASALAASSDSCSKESSEPVRMAGTSKAVHVSMSARPVVSTTVFCTISAAFADAPGSDTIQCVADDEPADAIAAAAAREGQEEASSTRSAPDQRLPPPGPPARGLAEENRRLTHKRRGPSWPR